MKKDIKIVVVYAISKEVEHIQYLNRSVYDQNDFHWSNSHQGLLKSSFEDMIEVAKNVELNSLSSMFVPVSGDVKIVVKELSAVFEPLRAVSFTREI